MTRQKIPASAPVEQFSRRMFTRIITQLARSLREDEFTIAQVAALHLIDQAGTTRVTALADELGLSASAGSRLVDGLVQRGLLSREEDPADRRAKTLVLTPAGQAFIEHAGEERVKVIREAADALPSRLVTALVAAITAFRDR